MRVSTVTLRLEINKDVIVFQVLIKMFRLFVLEEKHKHKYQDGLSMLANYAVSHQKDHERSSFRDLHENSNTSHKKQKDKKRREEKRDQDQKECRRDEKDLFAVEKHEDEDGDDEEEEEEEENSRMEDRSNFCKTEHGVQNVLENKDTVDFESLSILTKLHESTYNESKGSVFLEQYFHLLYH